MVATFGDHAGYDRHGPASSKYASTLEAYRGSSNLSEEFGRMDQVLAAQRNARVEEVNEEPAPKVTNSRIRVQLSRPLTWAEKEALETNWEDEHERRINITDNPLVLTVAPNFQHVWAEAPFGSRILFDLVAAVVEQHFVNVYPKAVRTFREYNGE